MTNFESFKKISEVLRKHGGVRDAADMPGRRRHQQAEPPKPKSVATEVDPKSLAAQIVAAGIKARSGLITAQPTDPVAAAIIRAGKLRRGEPV